MTRASLVCYSFTLRLLFSGVQDQLDNGNDRFVNQVYHGNLQDRKYNLLLLNRENAYPLEN